MVNRVFLHTSSAEVLKMKKKVQDYAKITEKQRNWNYKKNYKRQKIYNYL